MSETSSRVDQIGDDQIVPDQNSSVKHKWRGKFFSSEGKAKKNVENPEKHNQDVLDFLRPPSSRDGSDPSLDVPIPRIDTSTAPRWQSATKAPHANTPKQPERRRKPPRKPNLHVSFESAVPEIIGEGGDDAELPVIEVSRSRKNPIPQQPSASDLLEQESKQLEHTRNEKQFSVLRAKSILENDGPFKRKPLERKQTGLDSQPLEEENPNHVQDGDVKITGVATSFSSAHKRLSSGSSGVQVDIIPVDQPRKSEQSSYGVFNHALPRSERISHHHTEDTATSMKPNFLTLPSLDLSLSFTNSLTPIPSPPPPSVSQNSSISNHDIQFSQPDYFKPPTTKAPETTPSRSSQKETSLNQKSETRTFNIRSIAKNLGDDALADFASRVKRFNDIFQIGATVSSPLMDIPFPQWIRASAYWFLRGRSELEVAVRSEVRETPASDQKMEQEISLGLRQAYLDLAKAWWVVEYITPHHPELKRFGNASINSLVAILAGCGEIILAEQIGVHLAIVANMRALTMSMKRNNRLPSTSFEMQRLDSRIFVELPKLSPDIRSVLLERSQSSVSNRSRSTDPFFSLPVADTSRHFLYSGFFVDLRLIRKNDDREEFHIPCALSVLREKTVLDVKAVIASPDGQVNIVIQSEAGLGLSWNDVHWKVRSHNITFKLLEGVDAHIQLSEKDFKSLWGIHDYTKTVQKGLKCTENEEEILGMELKSFQHVDQKGLKMFQPDPAKGCSLRLFERKRTLLDGAGGRKIHNGHRLVVVTPPSTKTLRSINFDFGMQRPILFSYLHDDKSSPALLLKLQKPSSDSSMVMTFHEAKDRGFFHSLIDGTSVHNDEICSQPLPLESFSITKIPIDKISSSPKQNFMNALPWQQTRVINSNSSSSPRSPIQTSECLRICLEGETGSFVDRMSLGRFLQHYYRASSNHTRTGPGEMKMSLSMDALTEIKFFRLQQGDMTSSFASNKLIKEEVDTLCTTLECLTTSSTIRCFKFPSLTGKYLRAISRNVLLR